MNELNDRAVGIAMMTSSPCESLFSVAVDRIRAWAGYRFPPSGKLIYRMVTKCLSPEIDAELFPGIRVRLRLADNTQKATYWQGARFEKPTPQILADWGKNGAAAFFDIGANYGFFSYWMHWQCPDLQIYAFDPHPDNAHVLSQTGERNRLDRLHSYPVALGERAGTATLHHGVEDSGFSTLGAHPRLTGSPTSVVEVIPFDAWLDREHMSLPRSPAWVAKIDVEGYELRVLHGMERALRARAFKGLCIEINEFTLGFCGTQPQSIRDYLGGMGYRPLDGAAAARHGPLRPACGNEFFTLA